MVEFTTARMILLVIVSLVLIVGGLWYLRRRYKRSDASGNEETAEQRAQAYREHRDRSIPLRQRALKTPLEAKIVGVLAVGIFALVGWNVYSYMKTGSPTQVAAATETKFVAATTVTFAVGIWYERHRRRKTEGRMDVTYESQPVDGREQRTVTYHYDPRDVVRTESGPVAFERSESRWLGLFRLPKLHGNDRRFDNVEDPRPPEDKVGIGIPSHARKVGDDHWQWRTKGDIVLESPTGPEDILFLPPDNMSREQRMQRQTDIDNLQTEVKELKARNAELESSQRSMREEEHNEIDRLLDGMDRVMERFQRMTPGTNHQVQIKEEQVPSRSKRDQNGRGDPQAVAAAEDENDRQRGGR